MTKRKTLKEVAEQHPITFLVLVASAAVGSTFGVMSYFHQEQIKIRDFEAAQKVSYLEGRLASIERKLGPDKPSYFDVTGLVVTPESIRGLDKSFTFFTDINCYIAVPATEQWAHEITDELRLGSMITGIDIPADAPLVAAVTAFKVHLWKGPGGFDVATGNDDIPRLHLFPFVVIQAIDNSQMAKLLGRAIADQSAFEKEDRHKLEEILNRLNAEDDSSERAEPIAPPESPAKSKSAALEAERLEATEFLEHTFRSDFAGFMLFSQLAMLQMFQQVSKDCFVHLASAEKKGNVLYCHFHITLLDAKTKLPVYWDRELFFVSGTKRSYMVATSAPSTDRRSQSAAWITSWLSALRVPLD